MGKTTKASAPPSYAERLASELNQIEHKLLDVVRESTVINTDPNRYGSGISFIGYARWGWGPSDAAHEAVRMRLMPQLNDWFDRFGLLFPHPTPRVKKELESARSLLEGWLVRDRGSNDHSVPPSLDAAEKAAQAKLSDLRELLELLPSDEYVTRVLIDTNALIDAPDVDLYTNVLGPKYFVHVVPVVLRELDELKRNGRNENVREAARKADMRLKKYRNNGDVLTGARVSGQVYVKFEHTEPEADGLPSWLDISVPDDRFVASALLLQSKHPGSAFYVITSDINMQTKLSAVGMPYVEGARS
ncbi:hypothetical protein FHJ30_12995 [Arthrobacter sp. BB-1]|uniref:PIN domain-containing protein n=1 Tax=unclassified Arthrobacter TaxID=235627 RepID=UPI0011128799|nr:MULTISPECIES: PIN domain-containing protein [unclassified Arthrobacter]TNB71598.1 hypothetical protein FHJ30_12995 [Arthrobacter sp. BB-1]